MALIPCPECQKQVSTQALACPQCAFPFPGKQNLSKNSQAHTLSSCPGCGFLISTQARSCPHCGQTVGEQISKTAHESISEESWICPHCGMPDTRKANQQGNSSLTPPETSVLNQPYNEHQPSNTETEKNDRNTELEDLLPLCSRPPLWQDPSARKEIPYPRYPRNKNNSFVVGLIIFVLVTVSILFGALWQYQSITPLQAIFLWE